jgi:adenine/guanine phosphoribosyltransferase-like PRPP-binding protein
MTSGSTLAGMASTFDLAAARELLRSRFPSVDEHPDVAGVLRDAELLGLLGPALAAPFAGAGVSLVCAPEARGPILGALAAAALGVGLVLARKDERNHPGADRRTVSQPTWRGTTETFLTRSFDFQPDDRVLVVDDWITSGSSITAVREAIEQCGATYAGASVLVNKANDDVLAELGVAWLVRFDEIAGAGGRSESA